MVTDFLIQLKNSSRAYKKTLEYPYSNAVFSIAKILEKQGFIEKVSKENKGNKKFVEIDLKYSRNAPGISDVKLISKPSIHYYVGKRKVTGSIQRNATGIISTNKGIMTTSDAQKQGIGGELICQIF